MLGGFYFSTYEKATGCTRAQLYYAMGMPGSVDKGIAQNGLTRMYVGDNPNPPGFTKASYGDSGVTLNNVCYLYA